MENIKGLYVIMDKVAKDSGPIFEAKNDGVALRAYHGLLSGDSSLFKDEYDLYKVGYINKETMIINTIEPEKVLVEKED